jgi:hypothetical protein
LRGERENEVGERGGERGVDTEGGTGREREGRQREGIES